MLHQRLEQKKFRVVVALKLSRYVIGSNINFAATVDLAWHLPNIITIVENSGIRNVVPLQLIDLSIEEVLRNSEVIKIRFWHCLHRLHQAWKSVSPGHHNWILRLRYEKPNAAVISIDDGLH